MTDGIVPMLSAVPGAQVGGGAAIRVLQHEWGTSIADLQPPFDMVVACGAPQPF